MRRGGLILTMAGLVTLGCNSSAGTEGQSQPVTRDQPAAAPAGSVQQSTIEPQRPDPNPTPGPELTREERERLVRGTEREWKGSPPK